MSPGSSVAKAIFTAAQELPPGSEREGYLAEACGGDAELRRQVEDLLAAHGQTSDVLGPSSEPATVVTSEATTAAEEATGNFEGSDAGLTTAPAGPGGNGDGPARGDMIRHFGDYEIRARKKGTSLIFFQ